MAEQFKGIITGAGNKSQNINVITPEIDAKLYYFIIGNNGIINGFDYQNGVLSSGLCVAMGYRGYSPVSQQGSGRYIYGRFTVHHDSDIEDDFSVVFTDDRQTQQDDILHGPGVYWLELYNRDQEITKIRYPAYADESDVAQVVKAGGQLLENVTAETPPINNNSNRVATTKFVLDQIAHDMPVAQASDTVTKSVGSSYITTKYKVKRLAHNCVLQLGISYPYSIGTYAGTLATLPEAFRPESARRLWWYQTAPGNTTGQITLSNMGVISCTSPILPSTATGTGQALIEILAGYKIVDDEFFNGSIFIN